MTNFTFLTINFYRYLKMNYQILMVVSLPQLSLEQQYLGKLLQAGQHLLGLVWQLVIFQEVSMMKGLDQYCSISNKELQGIKGGFGVGVGIALFMAAYTIGKDIRKKFG